MFFIAFFTIATVLLLVFFVDQLYVGVFKGYAPVVSTDEFIVDKIIENINIEVGETVYELGSGYANFLRKLEKKFPQGKYIGIEHSFFAWLISSIQLALRASKIKIKHHDLFHTKLHNAKYIYAYLNKDMLSKVYNKAKNECRSGTTLISYKDTIPGLEPNEIISTKKDNLYFYTL